MAIAQRVRQHMQAAAWIRGMFEEGIRLKQQYGDANVFDFSLGNPVLEPPPQFHEALRQVVSALTPVLSGIQALRGVAEDAEMKTAFTPERAMKVLKQIRAMAKENDPEAINLVDELSLLAAPGDFTEQAGKLREVMNAYDFEAAIELVEGMQKGLREDAEAG